MFRLLHCGAISAAAMVLLSSFAMAQTNPAVSVVTSTFEAGLFQNIGISLSPLSKKQMSTETAQGLPAGNPALSPQGNNSVLLWDEVGPSKAASSTAPVGGTVTLSIVN